MQQPLDWGRDLPLQRLPFDVYRYGRVRQAPSTGPEAPQERLRRANRCRPIHEPRSTLCLLGHQLDYCQPDHLRLVDAVKDQQGFIIEWRNAKGKVLKGIGICYNPRSHTPWAVYINGYIRYTTEDEIMSRIPAGPEHAETVWYLRKETRSILT